MPLDLKLFSAIVILGWGIYSIDIKKYSWLSTEFSIPLLFIVISLLGANFLGMEQISSLIDSNGLELKEDEPEEEIDETPFFEIFEYFDISSKHKST